MMCMCAVIKVHAHTRGVIKSLRKVALAGGISRASMWGVTAGWRVAFNPVGF